MNGSPSINRDLLLALGKSEWAHLRGSEKVLARVWGRLLGVYQKKFVFDGHFLELLRTKIRATTPQDAEFLLETLKAELHRAATTADDPMSYRAALPEGLRRIFDMPLEDFDHPERFMFPEADSQPIQTDPAPADAQETLDVYPTEVVVARLEALRQPLLELLERLSDEVEAGMRPATDPSASLTDWFGGWSALPGVVATLGEARALVEEANAEARALNADWALIRAILQLQFDQHSQPEALAAVERVRGSVTELSPPLEDTTKDALAALLRVFMADWPDAADSEMVKNQFDMEVLTAAVRLTPVTKKEEANASPCEPDRYDGDPERDPRLADDDRPGAVAHHSDTPTVQVSDLDQVPVREVETRSLVDDGAVLAAFDSPPSVEATVIDEQASDIDGEVEQRESAQIYRDSSVEVVTAPLCEEVLPPRPVVVTAPAERTRKSRAGLPGQDLADASRPAPGARDYVSLFDQAAAAGDFALAYWYAVGGRDEIRARVARMLVVGTSGGLEGGTAPHPRANALAAMLGGDLADASPAVSEMIAAALVPPALLLPPYSDAALSLNQASTRLGDDCPAFVRIANALTYERGSGLHTLESTALLAIRDRAKSELSDRVTKAPSRTIRFHRATEVWREMIRNQGLLGSVAARALATPRAPEVRQLLADLEGRGIDRLIRDTDQQLNPSQAKKQAIIAGAKQELATNVQRYLDAIRAYLDAEESVRAIDNGSAHANTDLIEQLSGSLPVDQDDGVSAVATGVARWIRDRLTSTVGAVPVAESDALDKPLAKAFELVRTVDRTFDPAQVTVDLVVAQAGRTVDEAVNGYLLRHDYVGLEVLQDSLRLTDPAMLTKIEERLRRGRADSREVLNRTVEATRVALLRALAGTSLSEAEAQEHLDRLERVLRDPNPHYREALATLTAIQTELEARLGMRLDAARRQLDALVDITPASRARIESLIAAGDLLSVEEFLALLGNGATTLPDEDAVDRTLEEFWPAVSMDASQSQSPTWFSERLRAGEVAGFPLPHPSAAPRILKGLKSWEGLAQGRSRGFDMMVRDVLSALGFQQINLGQRFSPGKATSENVFEARYDGYALIPTFGSQASGAYGLFLCWERKSVDSLLQAVRTGSLKLRPTVVLYFQTLKPGERRLLAEESRRKGLPHIVIDNAAMAYLGTREEVRLDSVMHVCLPFAGSNPYTPFALGDVPREVFYGRREELHSVQDPNGPLFVYGGRQLGKSALLKTAMSEFERADDNNVSIYLDLKAEGVGEWRKADDLWRVLVPSLQAKGVIDSKLSSKLSNPDSIVKHINTWLTADARRRLLLLLDESDAFLDEDSRPRIDDNKGQFKNVFLLKNLMTQSARHFKPVFAGLHQVQRFHKESNGPMAHVGKEIPIGPLPPSEAFKLVVRPMEAIGYRFASPDVVWRLLSHTNYQASLIQLFCKELVNDLKTRKLGIHEPPTPIDAHTVDRVYENRELRGQIAQRFEWTIQLDNRYRVIALVAAWLNLVDEATVATISMLREQCSDFWPLGFEGVTPDEFRALLDEMVGLGVLVRNRHDHYGIRSPNVIRLLGSKEEIEHKLTESSGLELPTVFDPTRYRRKLNDHSRSPVTEAQAARMLANASVPTLVTATSALGADRLAAAIMEIADSGERVEVFSISMDELSDTLTQAARMRMMRHILLDARGADPATLVAGMRKLARQTEVSKTLTSTVLINPADRSRFDLADMTVRDLTLERWSDAELHAVEPEADVPLASETRLRLLDITGGWPDVLEPVLAGGRQDGVASMIDTAAKHAQRVVDAGWDVLAQRIGVSSGSSEEQILDSLLEWDESITRVDLAELLPAWPAQRLSASLELLVASGVVHQSSGLESVEPSSVAYRVNPLVARTMKASR